MEGEAKPMKYKNQQFNSQMANIIEMNSMHDDTIGECGYCARSSSQTSQQKTQTNSTILNQTSTNTNLNQQQQRGHWASSGFVCQKMGLSEYSQLLEKGWRRCGTYFYQPNVQKCCCRPYTLRLNVDDFAIKNQQKKVLNRLQAYLTRPAEKNGNLQTQFQNCESADKFAKNQIKNNKTSLFPAIHLHLFGKNKQISAIDLVKVIRSTMMQILVTFISEKEQNNLVKDTNVIKHQWLHAIDDSDLTLAPIPKHQSNYNALESKNLIIMSNILLKLYWYNKQQFADKDALQIKDIISLSNIIIPSLQQQINDQFGPGSAYDIQFHFQEKGYINIWQSKDHEGNLRVQAMLIKKIVKPKLDNLQIEKEKIIKNTKQFQKAKQKVQLENVKKLEIKIEKARFEEESYRIYESYCVSIHNKPIDSESRESYTDFLCKQALEYSEQSNDNTNKVLCYGCYHMKYYLDEQLIAVGVLDIMPSILSSVYFFYDPKYKFLSLGVVGALKEIYFMQEMKVHFPLFKYYMLGFYIQNNQKMVYKVGDYGLSKLLCPIRCAWVDLTLAIRKLIQDELEHAQLMPHLDKNESLVLDPDLCFERIDNLQLFLGENVNLLLQNKQIQKLKRVDKEHFQYFENIFSKLIKKIGHSLINKFIFEV